MSLYYVIFGSLIGSRIGEMGGYSYMEFVVPGLIMMAIVTNSYANVASSFSALSLTIALKSSGITSANYMILWGLYYRWCHPWSAGGDYRDERFRCFSPL